MTIWTVRIILTLVVNETETATKMARRKHSRTTTHTKHTASAAGASLASGASSGRGTSTKRREQQRSLFILSFRDYGCFFTELVGRMSQFRFLFISGEAVIRHVE